MLKQRLVSLPIFPYFLYYPFRFMHSLMISVLITFKGAAAHINAKDSFKTKESFSDLVIFNESFDLTPLEYFPFIMHYVKHVFRKYTILSQESYNYYYQTRLYYFYYISFHFPILHHLVLSYSDNIFLGNMYVKNMFYFINNFSSYIVHNTFTDVVVLSAFAAKNKLRYRKTFFPQKIVSPFSVYSSYSSINTSFYKKGSLGALSLKSYSVEKKVTSFQKIPLLSSQSGLLSALSSNFTTLFHKIKDFKELIRKRRIAFKRSYKKSRINRFLKIRFSKTTQSHINNHNQGNPAERAGDFFTLSFPSFRYRVGLTRQNKKGLVLTKLRASKNKKKKQ